MPHCQEVRTFNYTAAQLYGIVADVRSYPHFLPWCQDSVVHQETPEFMIANLTVGWGPFQGTFQSRVSFSPSTRIDVTYQEGPLRYLYNHWTFKGLERGGCEVDFKIDFEFKNALFTMMMKNFFGNAVVEMMAAFEKRAQTLYPQGKGG